VIRFELQIKTTNKGEKMKIKINDPFGFQKAINFEKLDDPKTLKKLSDIFGINDPQTTYKKSVNKLKRGIKKNA
jgi:hypothetical protein